MVRKRYSRFTPFRLASPTFVNLQTSEGAVPCQFVCKDAHALIGGNTFQAILLVLRLGKQEAMTNYPGSFVRRGEPFDLDVIFSVPKTATDLKLWMLGTPPVSISRT